jgi:polyhydroxyalkanoate synthesis regulator phasin
MMGNNNDMSGMMDMMSKMMDGNENMGMPMMQDMMSKMMPQGITMMLSRLPKEQRIEFAENMVATLVEKGSEGLSEEEKKDFIEKLIKKIKPEE